MSDGIGGALREKAILFKSILCSNVAALTFMKAFPALLVAATLLAPALRAQEAPANPDTPRPTPPAADAPASPKPDLTPAQDVPTPMPQKSLDLMPAQDPTAPTPVTPEPALIPETPVPTEKPNGSAIEEPKKKDKDKEKEKPNKTEAAADEMAARVRFREVKTRALKDSAVQTEWAKSEKARTDYEKREALKRYYKLLYARMEKIDGSLKKQIADHQLTAIRRLDQSRIEATQAPEPRLRATGLDYE